jgi:hypothetical protein
MAAAASSSQREPRPSRVGLKLGGLLARGADFETGSLEIVAEFGSRVGAAASAGGGLPGGTGGTSGTAGRALSSAESGALTDVVPASSDPGVRIPISVDFCERTGRASAAGAGAVGAADARGGAGGEDGRGGTELMRGGTALGRGGTELVRSGGATLGRDEGGGGGLLGAGARAALTTGTLVGFGSFEASPLALGGGWLPEGFGATLATFRAAEPGGGAFESAFSAALSEERGALPGVGLSLEDGAPFAAEGMDDVVSGLAGTDGAAAGSSSPHPSSSSSGFSLMGAPDSSRPRDGAQSSATASASVFRLFQPSKEAARRG